MNQPRFQPGDAPPNQPLQQTAAPSGFQQRAPSRPWGSTTGSLVSTGRAVASGAAAAEWRYVGRTQYSTRSAVQVIADARVPRSLRANRQ